MSSLLWLKFAHVLSAAVLFGTGIGIAYFMLMAHRSRDIVVLRVTARHVVIADWIFTASAVIVQPLTGALLMVKIGMSFTSHWFIGVSALYVLAGACWIPVIYLQYRIAQLAGESEDFESLPPAYHRAFRIWWMLGVPAFAAVLVLYGVMIFKPGLA